MTKIVHIITSLDAHGAQGFLLKLCKWQKELNWEVQVISLKPAGALNTKFEEAGIPVLDLNFRGFRAFREFFNLRRKLSDGGYDYVQTWLYHADFLGGVAAKMSTDAPVFWSIRHSELSLKQDKWATIVLSRFLAICSGFLPQKIFFNSTAAITAHRRIGYSKDKLTYIPNGYRVCLESNESLLSGQRAARQKLEIEPDAFVVLCVGRWHPVKNFPRVLDAMGAFVSSAPKARLILVGDDMTQSNPEISDLIKKNNLQGNVFAIGRTSELSSYYEAADVLVNPSFSESFPNVVAEAMERGTLCVVTDVGASKEIVGNTGKVLDTPETSDILAALAAVSIDTNLLKARKERQTQIAMNFEIGAILSRYQNEYERNADAKNN